MAKGGRLDVCKQYCLEKHRRRWSAVSRNMATVAQCPVLAFVDIAYTLMASFPLSNFGKEIA